MLSPSWCWRRMLRARRGHQPEAWVQKLSAVDVGTRSEVDMGSTALADSANQVVLQGCPLETGCSRASAFSERRSQPRELRLDTLHCEQWRAVEWRISATPLLSRAAFQVPKSVDETAGRRIDRVHVTVAVTASRLFRRPFLLTSDQARLTGYPRRVYPSTKGN